ncbi:hypothetical protein EVAR_32440_1 [Eumeta japonica]|uniref:Uncharacterized protein n=1 Tax=Eumeta variegata TaxID=151549 RepID=A0A4C1VMC4_EUMVA|nr:hypothetical protein EVAR_32440_1 [Eumeta japonica]
MRSVIYVGPPPHSGSFIGRRGKARNTRSTLIYHYTRREVLTNTRSFCPNNGSRPISHTQYWEKKRRFAANERRDVRDVTKIIRRFHIWSLSFIRSGAYEIVFYEKIYLTHDPRPSPRRAAVATREFVELDIFLESNPY